MHALVYCGAALLCTPANVVAENSLSCIHHITLPPLLSAAFVCLQTLLQRFQPKTGNFLGLKLPW